MSGWTESSVRLLKTWLAAGFTASEIASLFAERGLGVTRNAVIGKAHRLGLRSRVPSGSRSPKTEAGGRMTRKVARRAAQRGARPAALSPEPSPKPASVAAVRLVPASATEPVPLWLIPPHMCHFPVRGEGAQTLFCADAAQEGRPYCPYHHRIAHQPATAPARSFRDPSILRTKCTEALRDLVDDLGEAA